MSASLTFSGSRPDPLVMDYRAHITIEPGSVAASPASGDSASPSTRCSSTSPPGCQKQRSCAISRISPGTTSARVWPSRLTGSASWSRSPRREVAFRPEPLAPPGSHPRRPLRQPSGRAFALICLPPAFGLRPRSAFLKEGRVVEEAPLLSTGKGHRPPGGAGLRPPGHDRGARRGTGGTGWRLGKGF